MDTNISQHYTLDDTLKPCYIYIVEDRRGYDFAYPARLITDAR